MAVLCAQVTSFEERRGVRGRRFIAFCCEVRRHHPARSWKLYRRFNDFADLHQRLRQRLGAHPSLPPLPDRMRRAVLEREFGERCTKALNRYIQALLNDRELSTSIELLFFLHESSSELVESLSSLCSRLESALDFVQRQLSKIEIDEGGTRCKIASIRQHLQQLEEPEEGEAAYDIESRVSRFCESRLTNRLGCVESAVGDGRRLLSAGREIMLRCTRGRQSVLHV